MQILAMAMEGTADHPFLVKVANDLLGPTALQIQQLVMPTLYGWFGAEWHAPDPHEAIPSHVFYATLAFLFCTVGVWLVRGNLSVANPSRRQIALEGFVNMLRGMLDEIVGPYGRRYIAVIGAFAVFILVSNLMGLVPGLEAPTGNFNVPLTLGICSFVYYFTMGFRQQGLRYLKHFTGGLAGPLAVFGVIVFFIELMSNFIRPVTLGVRLFLNMFADHTIGGIFGSIAPWIAPVLLPIPLALFVAFVQTLVFVMLSMIYLSETVPHEEHDIDEHGEHASLAEREAAHAH